VGEETAAIRGRGFQATLKNVPIRSNQPNPSEESIKLGGVENKEGLNSGLPMHRTSSSQEDKGGTDLPIEGEQYPGTSIKRGWVY